MKYAVVVNSSYHVDGDERSRTNPGHGYPEHDVEYKEFISFGNQDELMRWVSFHKGDNFQIINYEELELVTEFKLKQPIKRSGGICGPKCTCPDC